ncbi:uncharacterized protein LOC118190344 [Stegodyphus dumicola]|uniref:uncharacterized protein LOC118190344 n=1 Tax=Stegodyphus dumicola TaxID=202533 RepID=UPI0015ABFAC9|nr:uncharacterized protein LOC118190344 [Stegodyphus dumicola]
MRGEHLSLGVAKNFLSTKGVAVEKRLRTTDLGDYHDLYVKSDVLLLADIFQNFRRLCLNFYILDPAHIYTAPGLAWPAALRMSGIELELLTDPDMYLFIEKGIRGGIAMISHRFSQANNKYVENFDPTKPSSYIMSLDANNLYGWAMSQALPTHDFRWHDGPLNFMEMADDAEEGCILEVDLEYPRELHDDHSDYPLAPEQVVVTPDMWSRHLTRETW